MDHLLTEQFQKTTVEENVKADQQSKELRHLSLWAGSLNTLMLLLYLRRQSYPDEIMNAVPKDIRETAQSIAQFKSLDDHHFTDDLAQCVRKVFERKKGYAKLWPFHLVPAVYFEHNLPISGIIGAWEDNTWNNDTIDHERARDQSKVHVFDVREGEAFEQFNRLRENVQTDMRSVLQGMQDAQLSLLSQHVMGVPYLINPTLYHIALQKVMDLEPKRVMQPLISWLPDYVNETIDSLSALHKRHGRLIGPNNYIYGPSVLQ